MEQSHQAGLYNKNYEHDACGIGAVVSIKGIKSHKVVDDALKIVEKLEHRAGKDADGKTGDGVGIMLQISHKFFTKHTDFDLGAERDYGIGMFFFPQDTLLRNQAKKMFELITKKEGMEFIGWRSVPISSEILGKRALDCMPRIEQGFVKRPAGVSRGIDFDRKLYVLRRVLSRAMIKLTSARFQAEPWSIRECFS